MTDKFIMGDRFKILMLGIRQLFIMGLGLVEDFLGVERSIIPVRKRDKNDPHKYASKFEKN
jgi:hypothetical protein